MHKILKNKNTSAKKCFCILEKLCKLLHREKRNVLTDAFANTIQITLPCIDFTFPSSFWLAPSACFLNPYLLNARLRLSPPLTLTCVLVWPPVP